MPAVLLRPMLASLVDAPLQDPHFVYEPKYDGIRAIVDTGPPVRLWSRLGNEKTHQFPEIADALEKWAATRKQPVVLDGEIVALDLDPADDVPFSKVLDVARWIRDELRVETVATAATAQGFKDLAGGRAE